MKIKNRCAAEESQVVVRPNEEIKTKAISAMFEISYVSPAAPPTAPRGPNKTPPTIPLPTDGLSFALLQ